MFNLRALAPRPASALLAAAVFASGAAGLMYETLWARILSTTFGSSASAVCLVLTVFMAGMAAGGFLLGRAADRSAEPLKLYAALELALGLYGLASFWLMRSVEPGLALVLMAPPAVLMGATLPVLSRHQALTGAGVGGGVSMVYAWNTFGGVFGTAFAGFWAISRLGVSGSLLAAAALSFTAAAGAWRFAGSARPVPAPALAGEADTGGENAPPAAVWAFLALSGFSTLAYEALWTRLLALVLGSTVYSFATILAAFLTGLALGGAVVFPWVEKSRRRLEVFGWMQLGIAAWAVLVLGLYPRLPWMYVRLFASLSGLWLAAANAGLVFLVLLPAALMMGMGLPWLARLAVRRAGSNAGAEVGAAYAVNTLGAALGPWAASFALVPLFGLSGAVSAVALINLLMGSAALFLAGDSSSRRLRAGAAAAALAAWALCPSLPLEALHSGASIYAREYLKAGDTPAEWSARLKSRRALFSADGVHGSVLVWGYPNGTRSLVINGKADASDTALDMPTQILAGHLPALLSDAARKNVLVVGLGSGVTAAAVARHPVESIEVVEIERQVAAAAPQFARVNRGVLGDPRVRLIIGDGRRHLRSHEGTYGVIISEPSNPWLAGVSHLFSTDFFALARRRLAPGGVFCHWLPLSNISPETLRVGLRSFHSEFPHVVLWRVGSDLLVMGSEKPIALDWARLQKGFEIPGVRADLAAFGLTDASSLLALWTGSESGVERFASGNGPVHTDDRPVLEFLAPKDLADPEAGPKSLAALESGAQTVSPLLDSGREHAHWIVRALLAYGRAEAASRELALLPAAHPWHDGLERDLGRLFTLRGRHDDAIAIFAARLKRRPNAAAHLDLARARLEGGRRGEALRSLEGLSRLLGAPAFNAALAKAKAKPESGLIYLAMGMGYARIKEPASASDAFARGLELQPGLFDELKTLTQ